MEARPFARPRRRPRRYDYLTTSLSGEDPRCRSPPPQFSRLFICSCCSTCGHLAFDSPTPSISTQTKTALLPFNIAARVHFPFTFSQLQIQKQQAFQGHESRYTRCFVTIFIDFPLSLSILCLACCITLLLLRHFILGECCALCGVCSNNLLPLKE